jgi:hypothetical protein
MEDVGKFYIWTLGPFLRSFVIFYGHLVYFVVILVYFFVFWQLCLQRMSLVPTDYSIRTRARF